ncbi:syntaxin-binding protein 5 isoform X4 [Anthonomus grandis grandis]|uniref:syntaxin-binding protein 5 isoform X4 n=1 Tax=Anthonomus grandis grandis TaxID=2921223 RepID=UPI0021658F9A|nr:syntaxin-binding protein 5 isoform X4 [Anthonomus grandis grandis]
MDGPPGSAAVLHLQFLVNDGSLISCTADDTLHLWSFKQKLPQIVQSLKFQKEKITCMHLPLQSKWLYVGTEKGNVHVVQIESFSLSGYIINWNKTIELTRKTHPGAIVHLSDNPLDPSKLLIGYESGQIVLWDLRNKCSDMRWQSAELRSIAWHYEGKQFMCSHTDGTLTTWNIRNSQKFVHISQPHAKLNKDGKPEQCKSINKVEWKTSKTGEAFVIFSGGMPYDQACRTPSITVVHNKTTTVLEMEHNVVDFITVCESPYVSDMQEPLAIIALLQNDLVVMDLQTPGYPCIENPYPMDIHESPVTCVTYLADCPADLIPAFYSVGRAGGVASKRHQNALSDMDWPVNGGTWSAQGCSYPEVILTGHADGSIRFWDASAGTLQVLYKLKTSKVFEKPKSRSTESEEDPFAVHLISLCPESRKLCVAGASSHVILFSYKKVECCDEVMVLEIPIVYEIMEDEISPDCQFSGPGSAGSGNKIDMLDFDNKKEGSVKVKSGPQKKPPGFQAQLVCLTPWNNGEPPSHITSLTINSAYGLMAYGNESGLVIVDIEQRVCLLNVGSPDLYGAQDPYSRLPVRSPKKNQGHHVTQLQHLGQMGPEFGAQDYDRQPRSPSIDQMGRSPESPFPFAPCPTPVEQAQEATEEDPPPPQLATRRKSSTWKGLKRQLSRVDIKLKNPLKDNKRHSIFYSGVLPGSDVIDQFDEEEDMPQSPESLEDSTVVRTVVDLRGGDDSHVRKAERFLNLRERLRAGLSWFKDKLDSSFSRSRSSSMSSLDNITSEAIQCLVFVDSYSKKSEPTLLTPTLWIGTSLGSVLPVVITPPDPDSRSSQPVVVSMVGMTIFRLKGSILTLSFLDCNGALVPSSYEVWRDDNRDKRERDRTPTRNQNRMSPTLGGDGGVSSGRSDSCSGDRQYVVIASEKQARIVGLPTQNCVYRQQLAADSDFVVKADVITFKDSVCLVSYVSSGHLMAYSLPSLRPLLDIDFLPLPELSFQTPSNKGIVDPMLSIWGQQLIVNEDTDQIARTFSFSNKGHGLYLASPSELQKFTLCAEFCVDLAEMMGELYIPSEMPEPPKIGFFKGLFGGGVSSLDREELFGESSGKANKSIARHIPGGNLQDVGQRANTVCSEVSRAHKLMLERGEKLSQLEDRAERMRGEAENFSSTAHDLMLKYRDKKWYQL